MRKRLIAVALALLASITGAFAMNLPPGFVRLADIAPSIAQDLRYATSHNFTGRPVPGYESADCWLRREAAQALAAVAQDAAQSGYRLVVYDCYRPHRATEAFMRWAADRSDQSTKAEYYPAIDKESLFKLGYISRRSTHSAGTTVDLGLLSASGAQVDFGSPFDLFDPRSATSSAAIPGHARANRYRLRALMKARGFANYGREWWHFTYSAIGNPVLHDEPIR